VAARAPAPDTGAQEPPAGNSASRRAQARARAREARAQEDEAAGSSATASAAGTSAAAQAEPAQGGVDGSETETETYSAPPSLENQPAEGVAGGEEGDKGATVAIAFDGVIMDDAGQAAAPAAPAVPQTPRQRGFNTKDLFISEYNPGADASGTADEWVFSVLAMIESHEAQVGGKWPPLPQFMFLASKFRGEAVQWFREYSRSLQAHERTPENLLEAVALRFGSPMTDEDAVLSVTNTKKLPTESYQAKTSRRSWSKRQRASR
jgi:hypothetical protein